MHRAIEQYFPQQAYIQRDGNIASSSLLRLAAGNCPTCGSVIAVVNHGQSWPLVRCQCGWAGDLDAIVNRVRLDRIEKEEPFL